MYAAVRRGSPLDYAARAFAALGQAVPPFWLGLLLVLVFGVLLHLLPTSGRGTPLHVVLPGITLGWFAVAGLMRLTRSSMLDVLGSEYVKLARIKGLPERQVIWKHAFKNAALPVITFGALAVRRAAQRLDHHRDGVRLAGARPARDRGGGRRATTRSCRPSCCA